MAAKPSKRKQGIGVSKGVTNAGKKTVHAKKPCNHDPKGSAPCVEVPSRTADGTLPPLPTVPAVNDTDQSNASDGEVDIDDSKKLCGRN